MKKVKYTKKELFKMGIAFSICFPIGCTFASKLRKKKELESEKNSDFNVVDTDNIELHTK